MFAITKLRHLIATAIILAAVLPSLAISYFLLDRLYAAATESVNTELNRALTNTVEDLDFQFEIFSNNFQLFAKDRYLIQALNNFLLSSHAHSAIKGFTEQTPMVEAMYLLDAEQEVVEEYRGSIAGLEQSEMGQLISEAIDAGKVKDGRQLTLLFNDQQVIQRATAHQSRTAEQPASSYGVAVITPLYQHLSQQGLTRDPDGYLLAVLPISALYDVVDAQLKAGEGVEILRGNQLLIGEQQALTGVPSSDRLVAVRNHRLHSPLTDNELQLSLFMHVQREDRMAAAEQAQAALTRGTLLTIAIASILAMLVIRAISGPFRQLTMILRQYQEGDYSMPDTLFRYDEFRQAQHLINNMGCTIQRQLDSLQSKNEELERIGALKDDYLARLSNLNEQLEQRVEEQTQELRLSLSQIEESNQIFQRLLRLTIDLQHSQGFRDLVDKCLVQLKQTFPDYTLAIHLFSSRTWPVCFLAEGLEAEQQKWLKEHLEQYQNTTLQQLPKQIEHQNKRHYLFPMNIAAQQLQGVLLVTAEQMSREHQAIVRLFAKFLSAILESRRLADDLSMMARTDELTGLPNRKAFEEAFVALRDEHERYPDRHFGLFVIDANGLKHINDRYGHQAGDLMLQTLADKLDSSCRRSDSIYRLGGDEYAMLVRNGTQQACEQLCERLQQLEQQLSIVPEPGAAQSQMSICFSSGFATTEECAPNRLFKLADQEMYLNKQNFYRQQRLQPEFEHE